MDKIILRELQFMAKHGVLPVEAEHAQPFVATIELELPLAEAGTGDRLEATVDYCAVQATAREVLEGTQRKLIEALAEQLASALLARFPRVAAVTVEILKPKPPVEFRFAGVAVNLRRERAAGADKRAGSRANE